MSSRRGKTAVFVCGALLMLLSPMLGDRTPSRAGWNLFSVQQDVEMGRALALEAERTLPFSSNQFAHGYINALGNQLAVNAPGYKFPYEFRIFMDPSINSFALPGGVIYVSSGLVSVAATEPQLAGALAHQIAHVVLRHGSQKVSQAYSDSRNSTVGRVSVADAMASLDISLDPNSVFLQYSTEEERQADVIGAQILYDARFDPRQMTQFFQRLEGQPVNLKSEFLSSHPGPADRVVGIRREVQLLGRLPASLRGDSPDLKTTQRYLRSEGTATRVDNERISSNSPPLPSTRMVDYQGPDFDFRYPENWQISEEGNAVTIFPSGGTVGGSLAWGMRVATFEPQGIGFFGQNSLTIPGARASGTSLTTATDQLIDELRRSNPNMRVVRTGSRRTVDGEAVLITELSNDSPIGGREVNWLATVLRPRGWLEYFVGVAPERDFNRYSSTFDRIISSAQFY